MSIVEYKKMRVDEMRSQLLQLGYPEEEVRAIKGKANLAKVLEEEANISTISSLDFGTEKTDGDFEPEEKGEVTIMEATQDETVIPPRISDPEWSDYVLSKFEYDEMVDGNPTVDGLRRVTELLLGNIVTVNTEIVQVPTKENEGRSTAVCTVSVMTDENQLRSACGSGDSWHKNTDMPYSKFPVAMAETRAEGRALRRVLQLRKVVAAEELSDNANEETEDYSTDVNDNQINFIDIMCKSIGRGLDINVGTLVKANHPNLKSIRHLTYSQATSLIQKLSHYQQNMETIPENIKGYDSNWRNSFDGS